MQKPTEVILHVFQWRRTTSSWLSGSSWFFWQQQYALHGIVTNIKCTCFSQRINLKLSFHWELIGACNHNRSKRKCQQAVWHQNTRFTEKESLFYSVNIWDKRQVKFCRYNNGWKIILQILDKLLQDPYYHSQEQTASCLHSHINQWILHSLPQRQMQSVYIGIKLSITF